MLCHYANENILLQSGSNLAVRVVHNSRCDEEVDIKLCNVSISTIVAKGD